MKAFLVLASCLLLINSLKLKDDPYEASNKVVNFLEKLLQGTIDAQREHDALFAIQDPKCREELDWRSVEVNEAKSALALSEPQLNRCLNSKIASDAAIASYQNSLDENQRNQEDTERTRDSEKKIFEEKETELLYTLNAIQGAYDIIETFKNGKEVVLNNVQKHVYTFLAQITDHINNLFADSIAHKHYESFTPLLLALIQLEPGTISERDIKKLVLLFKNVEDRMAEILENIRQVEKAAIDLYNEKMKVFFEVRQKLLALLEEEKNYNAEMSRCVNREQEVTNEANMKLSKNGDILDKTMAMCKSFWDEYTAETESRKNYIELLTKVNSIIKEKVGDIAAGEYSSAKSKPEDWENANTLEY